MRVRWVKVWIDGLASLTERFRDGDGRIDFEALGREEYAFRHAIITGDFSRSERARDLYEATLTEITTRSESGKKGADARWKKNTAAATTREGVGESTTGSNNSEARQSLGAGGKTPEIERTSASLPAPSPSKPEKKAHGEFGNVLLTDDEFAKLQEKLPNAWDLITELDQYIESQGKTKKYRSHYATLLNWSRRKATEQKPVQRYKNINDINQENYEKAMREIEAMCAGEAV